MGTPLNLEVREEHPDAHWYFDPAPSDPPTIPAETAVAIAWADGGFGGTSAQPIYALLSAGGTIKQDTPVWVVRFEGACVPVVGPAPREGQSPPDLPSCANTEWNVIVNANTGEVIASFGDR